MSDIILEQKIENYPCMISLKNEEKILSQMKNNSVCGIKLINGKCGTGFFTPIKYNEKEIIFLITNHHVIEEDSLKNGEKILIYMVDKKSKIIKMDDSRIKYTNPQLDITLIEIKKEDNLNISYIEIDEEDSENNGEILKMKYKNKSVYIIHYLENEIFISYGIIGKLCTAENSDFQYISHLCNTQPGSSGSPILSLKSFKIIGIHKGSFNNINLGILMKEVVEEFKKAQINNKKSNINNNKNTNKFNLKHVNNILNKNALNNLLCCIKTTEWEIYHNLQGFHKPLTILCKLIYSLI